MRKIAVGEDDLMDRVGLNQFFEHSFRIDRHAARIERPAQRRRITAVFNAGDLSGSKRNDAVLRTLAKTNIEQVKVPACGAENQHIFLIESIDRHVIAFRASAGFYT